MVASVVRGGDEHAFLLRSTLKYLLLDPLADVPRPALKPHEVLIRVDAAPINPSDLGVMLAGYGIIYLKDFSPLLLVGLLVLALGMGGWISDLVRELKWIYAADLTFYRIGLELYRKQHPDFYAIYFPGTDQYSQMDWHTWVVGVEYTNSKPTIYALINYFLAKWLN